MKYKVIEQLEIRSEPSLTSGQSFGILKPGFLFDVEEEVEGAILRNNNKWLKDSNGFFYWSGAMEKVPNKAVTKSVSNVIVDYNQLLQDIPDEIKETKGEGVTIAVLDTGCIVHPDLNIIEFYDAIEKKNIGDKNYFDQSGHGTFVTGLINSFGKDSGILGVAPNAKIVIVNIADKNGRFFPNNLVNGLEWILNQNPSIDIVNMSFNVSQDNRVDSNINQLNYNGLILLGAAGNNERLVSKNQDDLLYPSYLDKMLSVGSIYEDIAYNSTNSLNNRLNYVISPDENFQSILANSFKTNNTVLKTTSFTTAILTGVIALFKSYFNNIHGTTGIMNELNKFLEIYQPGVQMSNHKIYKRL